MERALFGGRPVTSPEPEGAPKLETLEKARLTLMMWRTDNTMCRHFGNIGKAECDLCLDEFVALALEEAAEVSENRAIERAQRISRQAVTITELRAALRASEAAVVEVTQDRDAALADAERFRFTSDKQTVAWKERALKAEAAVESLTKERDYDRVMASAMEQGLRSQLATARAEAESLTKERDEAHAALEVSENRAKERLRRIDSLERLVRASAANAEAARAEATKAETALRDIRDAYAQECDCDDHAAENCCNQAEEPCAFCLASAALRPSSPTPPTSPPVCSMDPRPHERCAYCAPTAPPYDPQLDKCSAFCSFFVTGFHDPECRELARFRTSPPTEEPLGTCLGWTFAHTEGEECIDWKPVPSPEPPREAGPTRLSGQCPDCGSIAVVTGESGGTCACGASWCKRCANLHACCCGQSRTQGIVHRSDGPCYVADPTPGPTEER